MRDPLLAAPPSSSSGAAAAISSALALLSPSREELRRWFALMHMARLLDDKAPNYLKQAIGWSYHAPCAGHDGIQIALGTTFRPGRDWLFPYYRDLATCLAAGITPEEIILNGMSKATDLACGGRHMSNHFAKFALRIQNVSSCVANHALHAVGLARAVKTYGHAGDRLLLDRRIVDLRGLLLRGRQRRLEGEAPGRLRRPGQRLRHLRAEAGPDGERLSPPTTSAAS